MPINGFTWSSLRYFISACSHTIALDNDSYDKIHSPFFKNGYYEQDVICEWKLKAPDGQRINLTFHQLQIDGHNGCDADFVRVGDTRLYCNVPPVNGSLLTASNDVTVTFMSKPGSSERKSGGFNMSAAAEGIFLGIQHDTSITFYCIIDKDGKY